MMENRSFDHLLGSLQQVMPELDGVPPGGPPRVNRDDDGTVFEQRPTTTRKVDPDPLHETKDVVLVQLPGGNGGFVRSYSRRHPETTVAQRREVMAYHQLDSLPALHTLARQFVVCDRWFCSVPGPTWTNRLFAMSGTSQGRVKMPEGIFHPNLHRYDQPSVFRRLTEAGRSWGVYAGDFPLSLLLADQRTTSAARHYHDMDSFAQHASGAAETFPDFSFIEPDYLWPTTNDDHPPHDIQDGQALIAQVYNALRANEGLWKSTLLVITYDENGGFYDHVIPPSAVPPDGHHEEYTFDQLGLRVPVILVSPWLAPGVCHDRFDHTSLLASLRNRWGLGALGARVGAANGVIEALTPLAQPRDDTPGTIGAPALRARAMRAAARPRRAPEALTDNQKAIVAFSEYLETETPGAAPRALSQARRVAQGPAEASLVARERARRFLRQRGANIKL